MQLRTIASGLLAATILAAAAGQLSAKPNFTGEWRMNTARSNFAPLPAPDRMSRHITQHEAHLKIHTSQFGQGRDIVTDLSYTTDGAECRNTIRGQEVTGSAAWDDDTLIIQSRRQMQGMEIVQREDWNLSADGQTLTISNHVETPQGAFDISIVLEKQ